MEYLNEYKQNILEYLLESNENIKLFESDSPIKLNKKWNIILNYPDILNRLKISTTTRSTMVSMVTDILLDKSCRSIHPILIIIFHYELREYIKYNVISQDDENIQIQLTSKNKQKIKELRPQINESFKIYWKLLTDKKIKKFANYYYDNEIVQELINSLYYKVSIEELINLNTTIIETKKMRFNDLCFCLDIDNELSDNTSDKLSDNTYDKLGDNTYDTILSEKHELFRNKILIEINENHHKPEIDFIRKTNIYQTVGKITIDYDLYKDDIEIIYSKLLKEISKLIYKNFNKDLGIIFYLVNIENMNIKIAEFFLEIYNKTTKTKEGIPIKSILDCFKLWEYTDKKNFMKLIKSELDSDEYFIDENDDFKKSLLTSLGVDKLIFLPRKTDFIDCQQMIMFVKMYNKFREGFFNTIETFLNNNEETDVIIYLLNKLIYKQEYEKFKQPLIDAFLDKISNNDIITKVNKKFKITLNNNLPILYKTNYDNDEIDINYIKNTFSSKVSDIIEEKFDNNKSVIKKHKFIDKKVINFVLANY